jgi:hypothetical protein
MGLPADSPKEWFDDDEDKMPKWIYDLWLWIVQKVLALNPTDPEWFDRPQMQPVCVSTVNVLKTCHNWEGFRAFNFFMRPHVSPMGVNANVALAVPMESDQTKWMHMRGINLADPEDKRKYRIVTTSEAEARDFLSPNTVVVLNYRRHALQYLRHPESKALAPDGTPCTGDTRGLLQRALVIVDKTHRISKECDSRWEDGDDADALDFDPPNYDNDKPTESLGCAVARKKLRYAIKKIGPRKLMRAGANQKVLQKICGRKLVSDSTLRRYEDIVRKAKENRK